jgi:6,7-dimethyl-8-ribityllumazine synthase
MTEHEVWPGESPADEDDESDEVDEPDEAEKPDEPDEPDEGAPAEDDDNDDDAAAEEDTPEPQLRIAREHAEGELDIPNDIDVLEGEPRSARRGVGVVVSRFNGELTEKLLQSALTALEEAGVARSSVTVMPVPGAFELPIGAMALAKTRRYSCIVALGCVIRGETAHFEYVAGEAASGIQLAALETGVPVSFGVLTVDTTEQAEARIDKGAEAVRSALEMADLFAQLRSAAQAG